MAGVVGVRFKQACRVYYFDPGELDLHSGDWVIVDSARGQAMAEVVIAPGQVLSNSLTDPLKPVLRKATQEDIELASDLQLKEKEAVHKSSEIVSEMNLPMKVIAAEVNLDANHVTVFFRAEERVDFRDLVKRLSTALKMRVELRQSGPRDAAKMLGGMGRCGRTLCCSTFLTELTPVSIKMAKDQDLPLNPTKISGVCGRLLCCLSYEVQDYRTLRAEKKAAAALAAANAAAAPPTPAVPAGAEAAEPAEPNGKPPAPVRPRGGPPRPAPDAKAAAAEEERRKRRRPRRRKKKPFVPATPEELARGGSPNVPPQPAEAPKTAPPAPPPTPV